MSITIESCCLGNPMIMEYLQLLEGRLKKSRFIHTLGVVEMSRILAEHYHADVNQIMAAAALHDYAKNLSANELTIAATELELDIDDASRASAELLHGAVGAALVRRDLMISDETVLNGIRYHTTGRKGMSLAEKIVYLADAIEPGRSEYPGLKALRELAFVNLDEAVLASVCSTMRYVLDRGFILHPDSVGLYNELLLNVGRKPSIEVK